MPFVERAGRILSYATLQRSRGLLAAPGARAMAVFFGTAYALTSMVVGQMLVFEAYRGTTDTVVLWGGNGSQPWNYPALLVVAHWGILTLPFFATLAMIAVSIGVGLGMSVSVVLVLRLLRQRRRELGAPTALGSLAGLTPAMLALLTLGACCSTTAAATAGIGLVAQTSGTTIGNVLTNNWYLGVFQMGILWVALLAQEQLIAVYGVLFGVDSTPTTVEPAPSSAPPLDRRFVAGVLLRAALLLGGVTWSLAMFAAWTQTSPLTASAGLWAGWLFQHQALSILAVVTALFPSETFHLLRSASRGWISAPLRIALLLAGLSLAVWIPPPFASVGFSGFANELLGALSLPTSWGAVRSPIGLGLDLYLHWALQSLLLGGFAIAVAVRPRRALEPILWSVGGLRAPQMASPTDRSRSPSGPSSSTTTAVAPAVPLGEPCRVAAGLPGDR